MKNQIKFVAWERRLQAMPTVHYNFRSDRKHRWLQKVCFWILRKLKCHSTMYEPEVDLNYQHHTIDTKDFAEQLIEQCELLQYCHGERPKKVLVGVNVYRQITGNPAIRKKLSFQASCSGSFMGLEIVIIPWMEGILVMPDVD